MSSSSESNMMRTPEKAPSFTQTCSMLHQYLKEKGQSGDLKDMQFHHLNAEILRQRSQQQQQQQQMNFFPVTEKPRNAPVAPRGFKSMDASRSFKSMDLFPQQAGFGSSLPTMTDFSVKKTLPEEPQKGQMTIFYGGQVIVFNDLPAEKAKEMMLLASKESSKGHHLGAAQVSAPMKTTTIFGTQFGNAPMNSGTAAVPPISNSFPKFGNQVMVQQLETIRPTPTRPLINDIPQQRKVSLQRFLAKRKDRINNLAPYQLSAYQMSIPGSSAPSKPAADGNSWLGLAALQTQ